MRKFKAMDCPVCEKFYFSEPNPEEIDEIEEYNKGEVFCTVCGWIYDITQYENPDSTKGFNKMSLNDFKKKYEEKVKNNPNYNYLDENMPEQSPHKCPVCGEYEFSDKQSFDICPVCGWEDDGCFDAGGANEVSLEAAINLFKEKRKENPNYKLSKNC